MNYDEAQANFKNNNEQFFLILNLKEKHTDSIDFSSGYCRNKY